MCDSAYLQAVLIQDVFKDVLDHVCPQLISLIVVYVNDDNADFVSLRQILLHGSGIWSRIKNEDSTVGPILSLIILYIMTTQNLQRHKSNEQHIQQAKSHNSPPHKVVKPKKTTNYHKKTNKLK